MTTIITFGKWCHHSDEVFVFSRIVGAEEWILTWRRVTSPTELYPFCDESLNPLHLIPDATPQRLIMLNYWYQLIRKLVFRLVNFLKLFNKASRVRSMFSGFQIVVHYFCTCFIISTFYSNSSTKWSLYSIFKLLGETF